MFPEPESPNTETSDPDLLSPENLQALIDPVLAISRQAGDRILEVYRDDFEVTEKSDSTPLTTADLEAHRVITGSLQDLDIHGQKFPVLSEESGGISFSERTDWETYWLVDPLDGTREFIARNGEFSVNIGLIHRGRPILGVVYAPVMKVAYYAARGCESWKQHDDSQTPEKIHVRKAPEDTVVVARSRSPVTGPMMKRFLEKLGDHEEVTMGSALKSCLVAEGAADVYARLGPTSEWDTGAAQCIVEEAGGHITDVQMKDLRYNTRESLINPHFFVFGQGGRNWSDYLPSGIGLYPA